MNSDSDVMQGWHCETAERQARCDDQVKTCREGTQEVAKAPRRAEGTERIERASCSALQVW